MNEETKKTSSPSEHKCWIPENEINKPIYRAVEIEHLLDIFETKTISLVRPRTWEDPYENSLSNCITVAKDKYGQDINLSFESRTKNIFDSCWSTAKETDATWRIYSPNKNKARIRTTIKKLSHAVKSIDDQGFESYLGKVGYLSQQKIKKIIGDTLAKMSELPLDPQIKKLYFHKRSAFAHEKEVRLITNFRNYNKNSLFLKYIETYNDHDICKIPINDPADFIEEIVFDPRTPNNLYQVYLCYFRDKYNFHKIKKSGMYECPNIRKKIDLKLPI